MPQYAIMRFTKQKGGAGALEAHHERAKEKYKSNPDIDTGRSKDNFHIVVPDTSYRREVDSRIKTAGCRTRKDNVRFVDTLITASPEFFHGKKPEVIRAFFQCAVDFLSRKIGKGNIFSAVVHMDEKTPHMHLCFTPITQDGRLSAKEIIGNRVQLTKWQDDFFAHMVKPFQTLKGRKKASKASPKLTALQVELARVEREIETLIDTLTGANPVLLSYVNSKIEELDSHTQALVKEIAALTADAVSPEQIETISNYLSDWEQVSLDDKRRVVDLMISAIHATSENINIVWKI